MKAFIGTKRIKAKPMNRLEYNKYRGWGLPKDENGADEGMLIEESSGYVTWSPLEVFNRAYTSIKGMTLGEAIQAMKEGQKVYRVGWNDKGMWVTIKDDYIIMKSTDNTTCTKWLAPLADILATDWEIIND